MSYIYRLIGDCAGGAGAIQAAKEMYQIGVQTGLPVCIIHNDRLFVVELDVIELGKLPISEVGKK